MRARLAALVLMIAPVEGLAQGDDFFPRFKDMPVGRDGRLSFSGEMRERFESYTSPGFGLRGFTLDQYLLQRILFGADLTVGDYFRAYVQLGHEVQVGKNPVGPLDSNHLDFHQLFLELALPLDGIRPAMRAGRQEIALGTQRLVSNKDGPNIRRAFDGFRLFGTAGEVTVNALATRPVLLRDGTFDDSPDDGQSLWGLYATLPVAPVPGLKADVYYLGYENRSAVFGGVTNKETRHSFGTRLFGSAGGLDYNFEGTLQGGLFGRQQIAAWMAASDSGYTFGELPWRPRLGLKANIYSGNPQRGGSVLGTFNPLFPRLNRETTLLVTANYYDVLPTLRLRPIDSLTVEFGWDFLWRQSTQDGIYAPPFVLYPRTNLSTGRTIGNQLYVDLAWQAGRHLSFNAAYVHFNAGETITQAGGSDVEFFMASATFRF